MSRLVLIKHSLPEMRTGVPASQWHLSAEGRKRAHSLSAQLASYGLERIYSSREPKAAETAEILATDLSLPWETTSNLHEHVRPVVTDFDQTAFQAQVESFFRNPHELIFGSESADQAYQRFQTAVWGILEQNVGRNLAIVAHGTVISLFISRACGIEPFSLWKSLGLPSGVLLEGSPEEGFKIVGKI